MAEPAGHTGAPIRLPSHSLGAFRSLLLRFGLAVTLLTLVALTAYAGRSGYRNGDVPGELSLLDAFYYATVSITTTGYGDIVPVSEGTRLANTLIITPARILFLLLLVGTTVEFLTARAVQRYREERWRRRLRDHVIVCGFGTTGRAAVKTLVGQGTPAEKIVVVDIDPATVEAAARDGYTGVAGDAAQSATLERAAISAAHAVVVAVANDATAVLVTLTARQLDPKATIAAAIRDEENADFMRQGGADSVVNTASAAGRLLGFGVYTPHSVQLLEDMLSLGGGIDVRERAVEEDEAGAAPQAVADGLVVGVIREGELLQFNDPRASTLSPGDRIAYLHSAPA